MTDDPPCKGCKQPTHPSYIARYGGYCLDCENAGVPDLMEELDGTRGELRQANERIDDYQQTVTVLRDAIRFKDGQIEELKNRLRLNPYVCEVCFTSSFEPCVKETKGAVKDPSLEAIDGYMCCGYCAMYEQLVAATADRDSEMRWAKQYHDDWVKARDELETQRDAAKALMLEIFGELDGNESASIGDITALIRDLRAKNIRLQEALEIYALEENWSSEGEYTRSAGVINSNGGEDERIYTIELDSRTVFVGNEMGDDGGWKIAKETLEAISEI